MTTKQSKKKKVGIFAGALLAILGVLGILKPEVVAVVEIVKDAYEQVITVDEKPAADVNE